MLYCTRLDECLSTTIVRKLQRFVDNQIWGCIQALCFGLSSAPSIFQSIIDQKLHGLSGVAAYLDDIIIGGKSKEGLNNKVLNVLNGLNW